MPQSQGEAMSSANKLVDFLLLNCVSSLFSVPVKDSCQKPACYEKTVTLTKEPYDSLGMTVAGGMSSRGWDLPIYVTNVDSDGVVGQEGSIRKGNKQQKAPDVFFHYSPVNVNLYYPNYYSLIFTSGTVTVKVLAQTISSVVFGVSL